MTQHVEVIEPSGVTIRPAQVTDDDLPTLDPELLGKHVLVIDNGSELVVIAGDRADRAAFIARLALAGCPDCGRLPGEERETGEFCGLCECGVFVPSEPWQ